MKLVCNQLPLGLRHHHRSSSKDESLSKEVSLLRRGWWRRTRSVPMHCKPISDARDGAIRRDKAGGTHPLRKVLTEGITHWVNTGSSNFQVRITDYPPHMREVVRNIIKAQAAIGWDNAIIKGFSANLGWKSHRWSMSIQKSWLKRGKAASCIGVWMHCSNFPTIYGNPETPRSTNRKKLRTSAWDQRRRIPLYSGSSMFWRPILMWASHWKNTEEFSINSAPMA